MKEIIGDIKLNKIDSIHLDFMLFFGDKVQSDNGIIR
jgi:hypothetical protein